MKQRYVLALMLCAFVALVFPVNSTYHIKDNYGRVRMSRVDRKSILISYGTYLTPGEYSSLLRKPDSFIKPRYVTAGPFDDGCFDLVAEFIGDTIVVYMGTPCDSENLNDQFKLARLPNAFGEKNWFSIQSDRSGGISVWIVLQESGSCCGSKNPYLIPSGL